jgi:hypothetical protein
LVELNKLDEDQLFLLFQKKYSNIINLNLEDEFSPVDWYIPNKNIHIEAKCRYKHFPTLFLEEIKYQKLIQYENCWYINSTPCGIFGWDVHKLEPTFQNRLMTKNQQFGKKELVWKSVAELDISKCDYNFTKKLI